MFCHYCGVPNPDVAKFCRKCGRPIGGSPQLPPAVPPLQAVQPPIVRPPVTAPAAEATPPPVAALTPVSSPANAPEPRVLRARGHKTIAAVTVSVAIFLIASLVFMHARSKRPLTLDGSSGFISSVAFSPDGRTLASGGSDGVIKLWDTARGQWLRTLSSYQNTDWVAFSSDGHTLASSGGDPGHGLVLWDPSSGSQLRVLADDADFVGPPAFSPDGRLLVADARNRGSNDGGIRLWDAASGSELRRFPGYAEPVFSPDGKLIAAWNKNESISLIDAESGNEVRTFDGHRGIQSPVVVFSSDGHLLANTNDNATITVWDAASGRELRTISDSATVRGIAFSPDGLLLASGSEDHTVKLWDVASGNKVRTLSGHSDSVNCVAFSPDGRLLASGGADGKVFLWTLSSSR